MTSKHRHVATLAVAAITAAVVFFPTSEAPSPGRTAHAEDTVTPAIAAVPMWERFEQEKTRATESLLSPQF